jgi:hypothetical protein
LYGGQSPDFSLGSLIARISFDSVSTLNSERNRLGVMFEALLYMTQRPGH